MSDDKEWLKGSIWPKWFKKIEALEKIIGDPVFYKKDIGSIIDNIEKEISELKELVQANRELTLKLHGLSEGKK